MSMEPISDSEGLVSIFNSPACTARIQHQGMNIFHVFVAFGRRTLFCYFCMRYYHVRRQLLSNHCNESRSGCKSSILSKEQISVFEKLTFGDIFANEVTPNYLKNQKFFTEHRCAQCTYFSFVFWLKLEIKSGKQYLSCHTISAHWITHCYRCSSVNSRDSSVLASTWTPTYFARPRLFAYC